MKTYLSVSLERPETRILMMISGLWMSRLIAFAVRNGLFEELSESNKTAEEISFKKGMKPDVVKRLLLGLVHLGLLENNKSKFWLTNDGRLMLSKSTTGFAAMTTLWDELFDGAWQALDQTAQTGIPGFDIIHGEPIFTRISREQKIAENFDTAMSGLATIIAREVAQCIASSVPFKLCDVGAGDGSLLKAITKAVPKMCGVAFDQPHVIQRAKNAMDADCLDYVEGDFFTSIPGAPAHILSNVIHDWSDEDAIQILRNVWLAQPEGGKLYLVEMMLDHKDEPILARSTDLNMLMLTGGRERSYANFDRLLNKTGFKIIQVEKIIDLTCLITARRVTAVG